MKVLWAYIWGVLPIQRVLRLPLRGLYSGKFISEGLFPELDGISEGIEVRGIKN